MDIIFHFYIYSAHPTSRALPTLTASQHPDTSREHPQLARHRSWVDAQDGFSPLRRTFDLDALTFSKLT